MTDPLYLALNPNKEISHPAPATQVQPLSGLAKKRRYWEYGSKGVKGVIIIYLTKKPYIRDLKISGSIRVEAIIGGEAVNGRGGS